MRPLLLLLTACGATAHSAERTSRSEPVEVVAPSPDEDFRAGREALEAGDVAAALERFSRACDAGHDEGCTQELELRVGSAEVRWDAGRVMAIAGESALEALEERRLSEACGGECPSVWAGLVHARSADVRRAARYGFASACARDVSACAMGCDPAFVEALGEMCEDVGMPSPDSCLAAGRLHDGACRATPSCARRYFTLACVRRSSDCTDYRALPASEPTDGVCAPVGLRDRVAVARDIHEVVAAFDATEEADEQEVRAALDHRLPGLPVLLADGRFAFPPHEAMGPRLSLTIAGRQGVERPRPSALTLEAARAHVREMEATLRDSEAVFYVNGDHQQESFDWTVGPFRVVADRRAELYVDGDRVWRGRGLPRAQCMISTALAYHVPSGKFAIQIWSDGMTMGDYDCEHINPEFRLGQLDEDTRQRVASRLSDEG